jgi:hypothetical protein
MMKRSSQGEERDLVNEMEIDEVKTMDINGQGRKTFRWGEKLILEIGYHTFKSIKDPIFRVRVTRSDGVICCEYNNRSDGYSIPLLEGNGILRLETSPMKLLPQFYSLDISVWDWESNLRYCRQVRKIIKIERELDEEFEGEGIFKEDGTWNLLPS